MAAHAAAPAVTLSPTSLTFGTQLKGTTSPSQTVTLTNSGTANLTISGIKAGPPFAQTNTCVSPLVAGASCTISVTFTPAVNGTATGTISVSDNAKGSPQTVSLTGTGTIGSLSPASVNFGNQTVGTASAAQVITLSNVGLNAVKVSAVTIQGANPSDFSQTNNCATIAAAGSCSINVTFTPQATGTFTATVNVTFTSAVSPVPATLTGTGINSSPIVSLSPNSLTFSSQPLHTISPAQNVTLSNTGGSSLSITSLAFGGANPGDFLQSNTCGGSVAAGGNCTISVQFQPTATGTRTASLLITDNATGSPQSVTLTGTVPNPVPYVQQLAPATAAPGSAAPTITVNGAEFNSGSSVRWNGGTRTTTFVNATQLKATLQAGDVANAGTGQVTVTNPAPGGGTSNPQQFQIESLTSTLAMGGPPLAVGTDPRGIVVADFNHDGNPDIAVVNRGSNTVSILLGNGDGTFGAAMNYSTGADPVALAVGDFNGDGKLDLVTANRAAYTISILLGNGDGTFQTNVDYVAGTEPIAVIAADLNGDGFWDVAAVNAADNTLSVFMGIGTGTMQPQVVYALGSGPIAIVAGDFNADGIVDLAVADSGTSNICVLQGNGDGTFQSAAFYGTGSDPDGLFAADLNGDGKLDLVAANNGSNSISVLLNNGNGTFAPNVTYPVGSLPFGLSGGDFYGNGKIDIAVANNGDNTVTIVPGNGDGTFNASGTVIFSAGVGPIELAIGDFNLDGRPDVVVANSEDNTISILLQVPAVTLSSASLSFGSQNVGSSSTPQNVVVTNSGSAALSIGSIAVTSSQYSETNNCPSVLTAGSNCTISVTFSPTTSGTLSANLTIADNAGGSPQTVSLLGTGVSPGVQLSPTSLTFASQVVGTTSPAQTVTLTNTGSVALSITSIIASPNFGETNTCGSSVAAGAACTISVTFTPTTTGTLTGSVSIADNATGSPQTVSLTGTGTGAPAVSLSPTSLTFVSQVVDTSSPAQTVTLTNTGSGPLTITSIATTGDYSQTNTCGTSVAAGANCTISVVFTPTATGTRSGTVVITDNASNSPQTVTLTGTGATPAVTFAPSSLSFGNQTVNTTSPAKLVKLTNNTGARLTITKIATSANYSTTTNNCGSGINAGAACNIGVTFTPSAVGVLPGTLTVTDSASGSPQTVPLTGTGIAASILFSPTSVTFADQTVGTSSPPSVVTLTNTGTAALTVTSVTITGTNSGDYSQTNTCGSSVAAGASCSINVTFTPTASGTRTANVSVTDSAAGSPQTVSLTGTGIAPTATLSPTSLTFSSQVLGSSSAPKNVTLSNTGNATLTITSIAITGSNPGDFSQTNNCGSALAEATSCTISVIFSPTAASSRQASLSVTDSAAGSPQTASLTGTATTSAVSFSTSSVTFTNQIVGTSSEPSGITLFNSGFATLTISSITLTGTNPGDYSQTNNCGSSVASWSYCTINVVFTPTVAGVRTASISVADNAPGSPQTVSLNGTGTTGGPTASISPTTLTFASQNLLSTSSPQTVTLTNPGTATLNISSIVAAGDYAQTNNCGSSLAAGANCTVQVTFSPSFTGTRNGRITFADNDPSTLQGITLTGTGSQPSSTVSVVPMQPSATPGQSVPFTASISGVVSSSVTWAVDGITGGNSTVGTISSGGLYIAPTTAGSHVITATSTANTTQSASVPVIVTTYAGTFVYHNDNGRTGQNLTETVLTTGNVNSTQFGKLFKYPVDGQVYAEPLYVQGVSVAGQGVHNVVYVVTQNDTVYAFDADGLNPAPLWQVSFLTNGAQTLNTTDIGGCANISPQVGITSTPVIDPQSNTIFVLARTKIVSGGSTTYYQTLHALDITTGFETPGSPVAIQASVNNGAVVFNAQTQNQRSGLFIDNGVVYISWGSHCDIQPFHGWMMGYQEGTLQQVAVFNTTPNGVEGGIWQSGAAPAVDGNGNIFVLVGNGTTDVQTGGDDYGEAILNLNPSSLTVNDYFIPSNYQSLNNSDLDLGSGGVLLVPEQPTPPTELLVAIGKQGMVYLADRTNLGGYSANGNDVLQTLPAGTVPNAHSMAAYWQNNIYVCGIVDYVKSFLLSNALLSTAPVSESPTTIVYPGATPVVSSNGSANGILWVLATAPTDPAELYAFDAANISRQLYNSNQNSSRDQAGYGVKFVVPTVANGKVYVPTQTELDVYGLLAQP